MSDKELWKLISIISEGQDSEQRRKVEQYITDLQKEIERLNEELQKLDAELKRYKSIVWLCEKVKDCDKNETN